jgi:hypothetical protein
MSDADNDDKVVVGEELRLRRAVPDERVVRVLDLLLRASTAAQVSYLRRKAPLFDLLARVRAACGGVAPLHKWLVQLAGEHTRDTELLTVGLAVRLLRTTDLDVEQVAAAVAHLVDCEAPYATYCTVLGLIRLEYTGQLAAFLSSPAGNAFKQAGDRHATRGLLLAQTRRPFAGAVVLMAIDSGAFASAKFLLHEAWFGERISLLDLDAIGTALGRLVHTVMARAESDARAVPLYASDELAVAATHSVEVRDNVHRLLHQLQQWRRQSTQPLATEDSAAVDENRHAYHLSRLGKLSQTAALVHVSVAQELATDSDVAPEQAEQAKQLREHLEERTRVCAQLDSAAPSDIDSAKVRKRRPLVLAALEDAIYDYRILLAAERSGHERALAASQANHLAEQARATEQSLSAIRAALDAATATPDSK